MNVVLGATGTNGRAVVQALLSHGQPVRAVVRDTSKVPQAWSGRVEIAQGDLGQPDSLDRALSGGSSLFLLAPVAPTQADMEFAALRAARSAGMRRVVKLSAIGADPLSAGHFSRSHGIAEAAVRSSGLGWVIVRAAFFYSNLLFSAEPIKRFGRFFGHWSEHRAAWVDPSDLAEVCARCMIDHGLAGATLTVTGPAALTNAEVADTLSHVLGRKIEYVDQSPEVYAQTLLSHGSPEWYARAEVALGQVVRSGEAAEITQVVRRLTGHAARTLDEYIRADVAPFKA